MTKETFATLKKKVFDLVEFSWEGELQCVPADCVYARCKDGKGFVGGASVPQTARALFLFAQAASSGQTDFCIRQNPAFSLLGARPRSTSATSTLFLADMILLPLVVNLIKTLCNLGRRQPAFLKQ